VNGWFGLAPEVLLVWVAAAIAVTLGGWIAKRSGAKVDWELWAIVGAGLFAARLGYVWEFRAAYLADPLTMLDVRDGGWSAEVGFAVLWLFAWRTAKRQPQLQRAVTWATACGTLLWVSGAIALAMHAPPTPLPPLTLTTADGKAIDLKALQGKPVVLNLWATWCPPCNREMPVLAQAQAEHPEVQFVFANQGENEHQVGEWLAVRRLSLRNVALDPRRQVGAALAQQAYPTTYFFDASGKLADRRIGELSRATLTEHLDALKRSRR